MTAFYNEIDPYAAQWLRNLIAAGHIAPGVVDERSIADIGPGELAEFTQCHFFAGIGVWSYALRLAGWPDDRPVWTGSCPCQPFSAAGPALGHEDERHLWPTWARLIRERHPVRIFGEQVASEDGMGWLDAVCTDLEDASYAVGSADLCAAGVSQPHLRQRLFWFAYSVREGWEGHQRFERLPVATRAALAQLGNPSADVRRAMAGDFTGLLPSDEPTVGMERSRTHAYGNAINAEVAQAFIEAAMHAERVR